MLPESVHAPEPDLVREITLPPRSEMAPPSSPVPAEDPVSVIVFAPTPVAVIALLNLRLPVPD